MKMKRILLIFCSAIVVGLVIYSILAIALKPEPITYPYLIGDEDCHPPCWMGIIPGETSYDEAISIAEKLPFVNDNGYLWVSDNYRYISWGNGEGKSALIGFSEKKVEFITIGLDGINLGSVVAHFGEPDGYAYSKDSYYCGGYSIFAFYPDLGLVFSATLRMPGSVSGNMVVRSANFLYPMDAEEFPSVYFNNIDTIMYSRRSKSAFGEMAYDEWEGFGGYPKEFDGNNRYFCIFEYIYYFLGFGGNGE